MKNICSFLFTCTLATVTTAHLGAMDLIVEELVEKPSASSTIARLTQDEQQKYASDMRDVTKNLSSAIGFSTAIGQLHGKHGALLVARIVKTAIETEGYVCKFHTLTNNNGWTPLHCAASSGDSNIINTLLAVSINQEELIFSVDRSAGTAFHCAAYQGHTDAGLALLAFTIKQLGKNKASELLCARNKWGATALHNAVLQRHKKTIRALLDFIVQEFDQQTAWKWICIEDTNEKSALDLASKKLAKILNQYDPMNNNDAKKSNCTVQ